MTKEEETIKDLNTVIATLENLKQALLDENKSLKNSYEELKQKYRAKQEVIEKTEKYCETVLKDPLYHTNGELLAARTILEFIQRELM